MSSAVLITGCHKELEWAETVPHMRKILNPFFLADPNMTLIEGEATGVDTWAKEWALETGCNIEPFPMSDHFPDCKACQGTGKVLATTKPPKRLDVECSKCKGRGKLFVAYAGPVRNKAMVKRALEFPRYHCIGVWDHHSRGTWGCMQLAAGHGMALTLLDMVNPSFPTTTTWSADESNDAFKWLTAREPAKRRRRRK